MQRPNVDFNQSSLPVIRRGSSQVCHQEKMKEEVPKEGDTLQGRKTVLAGERAEVLVQARESPGGKKRGDCLPVPDVHHISR